MKTVVISDVHGDYKALKEALIFAGVLNLDGVRYTDSENRCRVISIGDLANCAKEDLKGDLKCLRKVGVWIDELIVGNHEIPYLNPLCKWSKFHYHQEVADELERIKIEQRLKPAIRVGETLISHAGWDKSWHPFIDNAEDALNYIERSLQEQGWGAPIFSTIGQRRGGRNKHGGILWEDFSDLRSPFFQVVGHTGRKRAKVKKNALCIDTKWSGRPTVIEVEK